MSFGHLENCQLLPAASVMIQLRKTILRTCSYMTNSLSVGRPLLLLPGPLEHQPGDVSLRYAGVLADGVGCSMATSNLTTIDNSWLVPTKPEKRSVNPAKFLHPAVMTAGMPTVSSRDGGCHGKSHSPNSSWWNLVEPLNFHI